MALVLAVTPTPTNRALDRLHRELATSRPGARHDLVVVPSCEAALAAMAQRIPDLVVAVAGEPATLLGSQLSAASDPFHALAVSLLKAEECVSSALTGEETRWVYWFRPAPSEGEPNLESPDAFARRARECLEQNGWRPSIVAAPSPHVSASYGTGLAREAHSEPLPEREAPRADLADDLRKWADEVSSEPGRPGETPRLGLFSRPAAAASSAPGAHAATPEPRHASATFPAAAATAPATPSKRAKPSKTSTPAENQPSALTRARARSLAGVRAAGAVARRWAPRAAAAVLVLAAGVFARAYFFPPKATTGVAELYSIPSGSQLLVDGKSVGTTPFTGELAAGARKVEFRYKGAMRLVDVDVPPGGRAVHRIDWTKKATGALVATSEPDGAAVILDGKRVGVTPMTIETLPVGQHSVVFEGREGIVRRTVIVKAGETARIDASIYSGFLALYSPIEVRVSSGGKELRLDENSQVMMPPGRHEVVVENRSLAFRDVLAVDLQPGETTRVSVRLPKTTLSVATSTPADVWIDGAPAGSTPLVDVPVNIGTRELVFRNAAIGERRLTVTATTRPMKLDIDLQAAAGGNQ